MFKNNILEAFSKIHFSVPLFIYIPVIVFFSYLAFQQSVGVGMFLVLFAAGALFWSLAEYVLHRFVFHFQPKSAWGLRLHFIFHGVHHDYPRDKKRLVMPPLVSLPLAILFYFVFNLVFSDKGHLYAFFPGFVFGYLIYDMMHYAIHHFNFKSSFLKKIKQHHMLHHYDDPGKGFGVSSALWDKVLDSDFAKKNKNVSTS